MVSGSDFNQKAFINKTIVFLSKIKVMKKTAVIFSLIAISIVGCKSSSNTSSSSGAMNNNTSKNSTEKKAGEIKNNTSTTTTNSNKKDHSKDLIKRNVSID